MALKTETSVVGSMRPPANAMFEIFKANIGKPLAPFPGSSGIRPFTPQRVQQNFRRSVANPMQALFDRDIAPNLGRDAQTFAQGRVGETINSLSARTGLRGEQQAYAEWLRRQPTSGPAMDLAQGYLNIPQYGASVPERADLGAARVGLSALNAFGQYQANRVDPWGGLFDSGQGQGQGFTYEPPPPINVSGLTRVAGTGRSNIRR